VIFADLGVVGNVCHPQQNGQPVTINIHEIQHHTSVFLEICMITTAKDVADA